MSEQAAPRGSADAFQLRVPADPAQITTVRRGTRTFLEQHGIEPQSIDDVVLIVSELTTNGVRARPDPTVHVTVRLAVGADSVMIEVEDEAGVEFEHDVPALPPASATHGRGLAIVAHLSREVEFVHRDRRTLVRAWYDHNVDD